MGLPVLNEGKQKTSRRNPGGLSRHQGEGNPIPTGDDAEAWRARSGADLSDLSVVGGAAHPRAALQLLQAFLLFQVWGFCTSNGEVKVSFLWTLEHSFLFDKDAYLA